MSKRYIPPPLTTPVLEPTGVVSHPWVAFFQQVGQPRIHENTLAKKPTNLRAEDEGLLFHATDYDRWWRWNGSAWERAPWELPTLFVGILAADPFTHNGTVDTNGTAVTWVSGSKFDPLWGTNNRIRINGVWYGISSINSATSITLAASAGVQTGVTYNIAIGWKALDGTGNPFSYTTASAATATITIQNAQGYYPKFAAAFTGNQVAANAPGITGDTANENAHTHPIDHDHGSFNTGTPSGTTEVQSGAGSTVASSSHTHSADPPNFTGASGAGDAHKHGFGTLAVDATGQPAHMDFLPYVRL